MPYKIKYVKGSSRPYKIINKDTGKQVGSSKTRREAERAIRARLAGSHGR